MLMVSLYFFAIALCSALAPTTRNLPALALDLLYDASYAASDGHDMTQGVRVESLEHGNDTIQNGRLGRYQSRAYPRPFPETTCTDRRPLH